MPETDKLDCVVIGAGVIGLATARSLARAGRDVVVLESEASVAMHTSSRNSEVVHAGIYYPQGSLKAQLCVAGREALYAYCEQRAVPIDRIGKIIVASEPGEDDRLHAIREGARRNGVTDLEWLDAGRVAELEPRVVATAGLLSPSTGIVDSHSLVMALQSDLEAANGQVVFNSRVGGGRIGDGVFHLWLGDDRDYEFQCRTLVNAAGPWAPGVAAALQGFPARCLPQARYAKAHYFNYGEQRPFRRLIYPLPVNGGLGIHATLDLGGQVRFGPDVEWVDGIDYHFDDSRLSRFVDAIRCYFPSLQAERLQPGYTGIRPKLSGPGEPAADFLLQMPADHGVGGLANLCGVESPGLTAVLAIADWVCDRLE